MSINWQWNEVVGECIYEGGAKTKLYSGNCLLIAINEFENDTYSLAWFAADKEHLANMLGITKGFENCFEHFEIQEITLSINYSKTPEIVKLLCKAKTNIKIKIEQLPYKGD